jgi:hypothetical protein
MHSISSSLHPCIIIGKVPSNAEYAKESSWAASCRPFRIASHRIASQKGYVDYTVIESKKR